MCHRYSVMAPVLPITVTHHTRGRWAIRRSQGAAATAAQHSITACPASSSDGGARFDSRWPGTVTMLVS